MKYAIELTAASEPGIVITSVFGVEIPSWLRVFDCRCAPGTEFQTKAPWGSTLMGTEKAEVDLGLRGPGVWNATTPMSCSTYTDARTCDVSELTRQLTDAVTEATKLYNEYQAALALRLKPGYKKPDGGSCLYLPVAVTISNFGWGITSDSRTCVVRQFDPIPEIPYHVRFPND